MFTALASPPLQTQKIGRADGLFPPSYQRSGDGARQWSRIFPCAQQAVGLSQTLTPASSSCGRLHWNQENHGQRCVRNKEHIWRILCVPRSNWTVRWLDVCICTDAVAVEVVRVSEETRFRISVPGHVRFVPSRQMLT